MLRSSLFKAFLVVFMGLGLSWGCNGQAPLPESRVSDLGQDDSGTPSNPDDAGDAGDVSDASVQPPADGGETAPPMDGGSDAGVVPAMSFFVTSRGSGKGGDLRANADETDGLAGADALCKTLATAVSPALGAKTWRAYLSTATVNARDRIGPGPWRNAKGILIAQTVAQLHEEGGLTNALGRTTALDELGNEVPGAMRPAGTLNVHDVLTGSLANGTVAADLHCTNWTSNAGNVAAQVGHSDRMGGNSVSWNASHTTGGCTEMGANSVRTGGGRGSIYCFALGGD